MTYIRSTFIVYLFDFFFHHNLNIFEQYFNEINKVPDILCLCYNLQISHERRSFSKCYFFYPSLRRHMTPETQFSLSLLPGTISFCCRNAVIFLPTYCFLKQTFIFIRQSFCDVYCPDVSV
jgi:hypothetical protein